MSASASRAPNPAQGSASLSDRGGGHWRLEGRLDFTTAAALHARSDELLAAAATLDLAGVESANSAAVALLLEWRRLAARRGVALTLEQVPEAVLRVARLSQVETLLLSGAEAGRADAGDDDGARRVHPPARDPG